MPEMSKCEVYYYKFDSKSHTYRKQSEYSSGFDLNAIPTFSIRWRRNFRNEKVNHLQNYAERWAQQKYGR